MIKIDICDICIHEDFGYCGLRNKSKELIYKHDKDSNLLKCSGFCANKTTIDKRFNLDEQIKDCEIK